MNAVRVSCAAIALSFVLAASAAAQSASLEARVTDPDRAVVVSAPVVLTNVQSGQQQTGLTGNDGTFRFTALTPGEYRSYEGDFDPTTRFVGVIAGYRDIHQAEWKSIVEMPEKSVMKFLKRSPLVIKAESLSISISAGE